MSIFKQCCLFIATLMLASSCAQDEQPNSFMAPTLAEQGLQGKPAIVRQWHYRLGDEGAWALADARTWKYDTLGRLVEQWAWKGDAPRSHVRHLIHPDGSLRLEDERVLQGKPGGQRRFHASGALAYSQQFNAAGQLIERVERESDAQGRPIRRSQVIYRHDKGRERVATRLEWRSEYLGGDSVRKTMTKNGALKELETLVDGKTVSISYNDDQGQLERKGKPVPTQDPNETRFVYQDASGRMVEMQFETTLANGGSSSERRVLNADGSLSSMEITVSDARGRLVETRFLHAAAGGEGMSGPVGRYLYVDDAQGNWTMKVLLEDGRMREVWARRIR